MCLDTLEALRVGDHAYRTVVLDTLIALDGSATSTSAPVSGDDAAGTNRGRLTSTATERVSPGSLRALTPPAVEPRSRRTGSTEV